MAAALERHDAIVGEVVAAHGGTLLKSKLEGDATVSVFARATEGAAAALALLDALDVEPWPEGASPRVRMAMHTGEAFERGGDYFGPALEPRRAACVRSRAPTRCCCRRRSPSSSATTCPTASRCATAAIATSAACRAARTSSSSRDAPDRGTADRAATRAAELDRPPVPAALDRGRSVRRPRRRARAARPICGSARSPATSGAVFIGGEPGVGKSRLAGEIAQRAHAAGGLVLYGRCDEDLAAPLQPFIEAVRTLAPALGADAAARGARRRRADAGSCPSSTSCSATQRRRCAPIPTPSGSRCSTRSRSCSSRRRPRRRCCSCSTTSTGRARRRLSLLRHLLRGAKDAPPARRRHLSRHRARAHASARRDARRLAARHRHPSHHARAASAPADVDAYLAAIGNTDRALGRELAEVTSGNPFFLIEVRAPRRGSRAARGSPERCPKVCARRPGGASRACRTPRTTRSRSPRSSARRSTSRSSSRCAAPISSTRSPRRARPGSSSRSRARSRASGSRTRSSGRCCSPELVTLKRVRLHRTIAELLEAAPPAADPDARLADLAYHWFECASTGSADKAVDACRRAADRAMERLAYEEAGDLYGMALQALEWVDDADPDEQRRAAPRALRRAADRGRRRRRARRDRRARARGRGIGTARRLVHDLRRAARGARRARPADRDRAVDRRRRRRDARGRRSHRRGQGALRARVRARTARPDRRGRARARRRARGGAQRRRPAPRRRDPRRGAAGRAVGTEPGDARERPLPRRRARAAHHRRARRRSKRSRCAAKRCSKRCAAGSTRRAG